MIRITWDRRKTSKGMAVFHRILTVTNLMFLAGNRPEPPK